MDDLENSEFVSSSHSNAEALPLWPSQRALILYRIDKCQRMINEMQRNPEIQHHKKMEATFSLLDVIRKLQMIDNSIAYDRDYKELDQTIKKWTKVQYVVSIHRVIAIDYFNLGRNRVPREELAQEANDFFVGVPRHIRLHDDFQQLDMRQNREEVEETENDIHNLETPEEVEEHENHNVEQPVDDLREEVEPIAKVPNLIDKIGSSSCFENSLY